MLLTINENGNVEAGFLKTEHQKELENYRDSLLKINKNNFVVTKTEYIKELRCLDDNSRYKVYRDGEVLVNESFLKILESKKPSKKNNYLFERVDIRCQHLITIQILTRILKDWEVVSKRKIISGFVNMGIMDLVVPVSSQPYIIPDGGKSHIGIEKLTDEERLEDLKSFRNSLNLLEYVVLNEYKLAHASLEDLKDLMKKLNTNLNDVYKNTQVLFGDKNKNIMRIKK